MIYSITPRRRGERARTLLSVIFLCTILMPLLSQAQDVIKIGVLAKRGVEHTLEQWQPTAAYLDSQMPEHRFEIVPLGFDEIIPAVIHQDIQFVLANPSFYVELELNYGVSRIATLINNCNGIPCTAFGGVIWIKAASI